MGKCPFRSTPLALICPISGGLASRGPCYNLYMEIEYEAKFVHIDIDEVRARLAASGATCTRPEFLQRRWVLDLPNDQKSQFKWLRVRDEGDQITLSLKSNDGDTIEDQRESSVVIGDFDTTVDILKRIGCTPEAYQETRREIWTINNAEITIDTWPFMETFVEVEGPSEQAVKDAALATGFDWDQALFCGVNKLFQMKYGESTNIRTIPKLVFDMENPFQ